MTGTWMEVFVNSDGTVKIFEPGVWHQEYLCEPETVNILEDEDVESDCSD